MGVALLVVAVGDHHLRALPADDLDQPAHGLVQRRVGEGRRVGVGLGLGHARVAVAQQHDLVVADDLGRRGQLVHADLCRFSRTSGRSMAGLRMSPSSPPVQHTRVVRTPRRGVEGHRAGSLGRLVVGVGMDREQRQGRCHPRKLPGLGGPATTLPRAPPTRPGHRLGSPPWPLTPPASTPAPPTLARWSWPWPCWPRPCLRHQLPHHADAGPGCHRPSHGHHRHHRTTTTGSRQHRAAHAVRAVLDGLRPRRVDPVHLHL